MHALSNMSSESEEMHSPMIMLHNPHFVCDLLKGRGPLAPVQVGIVVDGEVGVRKICGLTILGEVTTLICTPVVGRRVTVALRRRQVAYRHLGVAWGEQHTHPQWICDSIRESKYTFAAKSNRVQSKGSGELGAIAWVS